MGSFVERVLKTCSNGSMPFNKMAALHIYGKTTLTSSSPEQRKLVAESWYIALGTQDLPSLLKK